MKKYTKIIPLIVTPTIMTGTMTTLASCNNAPWYEAQTSDVTVVTPFELVFNFGKNKNVRIGNDVYDWIDTKISAGTSYFDLAFTSATEVDKMECILTNRTWGGSVFGIKKWFPTNVKNLTIDLSGDTVHTRFGFGYYTNTNVFLDPKVANRWEFNELKIIYSADKDVVVGNNPVLLEEGAFINKLIFQNVKSNENFTPEIKTAFETNFSLSGKVFFE